MRVARLAIIDVIESRHGIDLVVDESWDHLWGADSEQSYGSVLAAAMFVEDPRRASELLRPPCERYRALQAI